jgi:hypothetical protein
MQTINKGYCYYCGQETDMENYEDIGGTRLWVCNHDQCRKEFRIDYQSHLADEAEKSRSDREQGWMSY